MSPKSPRGGKRKGAGRKPGSASAKTLRIIAITAAATQAKEAVGKAIEEAQALGLLDGARKSASARKMAKEVLGEFMMVFAGMAAVFQPQPPDQQQSQHASEEKFERWARLAVEAAAHLAKYESPTFKAINVNMGAPEVSRRLGDDAKVIDITDAATLARVYKTRVRRVEG